MTETTDLTILYTDLCDLPLYNWIELAVSQNLKWLVKSGPIPDDLTDHYQTLLTEYQLLVKDTKTDIEHKLKVEYAVLANRIDQVNLALSALKMHGYDEDIIRILQADKPQGLGFWRVNFEDLNKGIELVETFLAHDKKRFEQAKNQLDKIIKASAHDGGNSKGMFYEQIVSLSKWIGFGINPKQTSVIEYVSYLNMLQVEIKANRK